MAWLIEPDVLTRLESAENSGFIPTASQRDEYLAFSGDITKTAGRIAQVEITGVLTPKRDIFSMFFGGGNTTYTDIVRAVKAADDDANFDSIDLLIDSPGGRIDGLFDAMDEIRKTKKHVRAVVKKATSAAYGLAAQANEIVAHNKGSSVGSIGIVVDARVDRDVISITSSNAPFKRPDITTDVGKAIVRSELDDVENLFIEGIALGRNIRMATVITDFGKGAVFLASEAMRRGMIDSIGVDNSPVISTVPAPTGTPIKRANSMNITQLKADHPEVYEAVYQLGVSAGNHAGIETERKRVAAHIKLGNKFNAMQLAVKACEEGTDLNDPMALADYMSAMADARDLAAAQNDSAGNTIDAVITPPATSDDTAVKEKQAVDNIFKIAAEKLGLETKQSVKSA